MLDRIVLTQGDIAVKTASGQKTVWSIVDLTLSAPRPLYQPQIDDGKLSLSATPSQAGGLCDIEQKAFVEETGIDKASIVSFGVLTPAGGAVTVDYNAILKNFFGNQWDLYDISIRIRPLVNLTICPNVKIGQTQIQRDNPMCRDVPPGVWVRSTAGGRVVVTVIYCGDVCGLYSREYNLAESGSIYQVNVLDSQLANLLNSDGVVVYAQRVDYPRAFDIYGFNLTNRPLAFGMFLPLRGRQLWLLHDSLCSADSNTPALGVRYLSIYTGSGFIELGSDITLNPGRGAGVVKVDHCGGCTSTARCAACWVDVPADALFAVVWVESSGQGLRSLVVVPLMPVPPLGAVELNTWKRWISIEPKLQTAVATRVVDSQSVTYLLEVVVYRKP